LRAIYEEHVLDNVVKQQVELAPTADGSSGAFHLPHHAVRRKAVEKLGGE
jgi:hypothetical protein